MEKFRFLNWKVYKDAKELFKIILEIVKNLPNELRYAIGGQLTRSAFSIILNISEGSGKESDKELNRYFEISLASSYELLACVDTLKDCCVIDAEKHIEIFNRIDEITSQLGGFKKILK